MTTEPAPDSAPGPSLHEAGPDTHPASLLNDTVHQRYRLGILVVLAEARQAEFGYLQQVLSLTAGNLSRHLAVLEEAGLVALEKGYAGRRPKTWARITRQGQKALDAEMAALRQLVDRHNGAFPIIP